MTDRQPFLLKCRVLDMSNFSQSLKMAFTSTALLIALCICGFVLPAQQAALAQSMSEDVASILRGARPKLAEGQTATHLPDGRWLVLGFGVGASGEHAAMIDASGARTVLPAGTFQRRHHHSATLMPDGAVLVIGGTNSSGQLLDLVERYDPQTGISTRIEGSGLAARSGHTATLLADGRVLIAGGKSLNGAILSYSELYTPTDRSAARAVGVISVPRDDALAGMSPTGEVLIWAGRDIDGKALASAELFDPRSERFRHLTASGAQEVAASFMAGPPAIQYSVPNANAAGVPIARPLVLGFSKRMDVASLNTKTVTLLGPTGPVVIGSVPVEDGMMLFVTPAQELRPGSAYTLFVKGAKDQAGRELPLVAIGFKTENLEAARVNQAGSAAQAIARAAVTSPSSTQAAMAATGTGPASAQIAGSKAAATQGNSPSVEGDEKEVWIPSAQNFKGMWFSGRRHLASKTLPKDIDLRRALHGDADQIRVTPADIALNRLPARKMPVLTGNTAVSGQVLRLNGRPLVNATLSIGELKAKTDQSGEFSLRGISSGHQTLVIDGETADRGKSHYGRYEYGVDVKAGENNTLPFVIWMTQLDDAHAAPIDSPTKMPVVLKNPSIPGLELRIPAGTVVRGSNGKIVTELTITAIPVDQPPFPLPNIPVPVYFTVQPGGAHLEGINAQSAKGAQLIYPNYTNDAPGTRFSFWNYDPVSRGWFQYGEGTVTADGKQVVPDPGVVIHEFTGAMVGSPGNGPNSGPKACKGGDPVDLFTGLFLNYGTDLVVSDVVPITISRAYRPADNTSRAFGIGTSLSYDFYMVGDTNPWTYQDLITPDGAHIRFRRVSPGTGVYGSFYQSVDTNSEWDGAVLDEDHGGIPGMPVTWLLTRRDGTTYYFRDAENTTNPRKGAVYKIRDRYGNVTTLNREDASNYNLTSIVSPNGRQVTLSYDEFNRIYLISDDIGRTLKYGYDTAGRLQTVTDPDNKVESFTYETKTVLRDTSIGAVSSTHNMITVVDKRNNRMVLNEYYDDGRVKKQTYPDGRTFSFAYNVGTFTDYVRGGLTLAAVSQTDITDERGTVTRYTFNTTTGLPTQVTQALGLPEQRTYTYTYDPLTSRLSSVLDPRNRKTTYKYDALGNVTEVTRLADTADANTTLITYEPAYSRVTSVTGPNKNPLTLSYDALGNLTKASNALGEEVNLEHDGQGRLTAIVDKASNRVQYDYTGPDLTSITDPLSNTASFVTDGVGRVTSVKDPLGNRSTFTYDALDRVTALTNPKGDQLRLAYDENGNVLTETDEKSNVSTYTYDKRNRLSTQKDALLKTVTIDREAGGKVNKVVDRKQQLASITYDALGRMKLVGYGATVAAPTAFKSTVELTWDEGDRLKKVVDSVSGTITRDYDEMDRLTSETTPQGVVSYTYDAGGRRSTMTVQGQPTVHYTWDDGNHLKQIQQDAGAANGNAIQTVGFDYDTLGRLGRVTYSNGITATYDYTNASRVKSITYAKSDSSVIGNLTYTYDAKGLIIGRGGSLTQQAQAASPTTTTPTYNVNNQLTVKESKTLTYDLNGNLTNDGLGNTYVWDERNRLVGITGTVTASFQYDALGRRISKTVAGSTTAYLYDGANFVQEKAGAAAGAAVTANLLTGFGMDALYNRADASGAVATVLTDLLGSAIVVTDKLQATTVTYTYDAYGNTTQLGTSGNSQQYTGREKDATGLYYYRARYYQPTIGRFISEDPIGWASGQSNQYAYVGGNPIGYRDSTGNFAALVPLVMEGALGAGIAYTGYQALNSTWDLIFNGGGNQGPDGGGCKEQRPSKTPNRGEPGSIHTNPGSGQQRGYGDDGWPDWDVDWDQHHGPDTEVPHGHEWDRNDDGTPHRGPPIPIYGPWQLK